MNSEFVSYPVPTLSGNAKWAFSNEPLLPLPCCQPFEQRLSLANILEKYSFYHAPEHMPRLISVHKMHVLLQTTRSLEENQAVGSGHVRSAACPCAGVV